MDNIRNIRTTFIATNMDTEIDVSEFVFTSFLYQDPVFEIIVPIRRVFVSAKNKVKLPL
jgi:hypothetical protein